MSLNITNLTDGSKEMIELHFRSPFVYKKSNYSGLFMLFFVSMNGFRKCIPDEVLRVLNEEHMPNREWKYERNKFETESNCKNSAKLLNELLSRGIIQMSSADNMLGGINQVALKKWQKERSILNPIETEKSPSVIPTSPMPFITASTTATVTTSKVVTTDPDEEITKLNLKNALKSAFMLNIVDASFIVDELFKFGEGQKKVNEVLRTGYLVIRKDNRDILISLNGNSGGYSGLGFQRAQCRWQLRCYLKGASIAHPSVICPNTKVNFTVFDMTQVVYLSDKLHSLKYFVSFPGLQRKILGIGYITLILPVRNDKDEWKEYLRDRKGFAASTIKFIEENAHGDSNTRIPECGWTIVYYRNHFITIVFRSYPLKDTASFKNNVVLKYDGGWYLYSSNDSGNLGTHPIIRFPNSNDMHPLSIGHHGNLRDKANLLVELLYSPHYQLSIDTRGFGVIKKK